MILAFVDGEYAGNCSFESKYFEKEKFGVNDNQRSKQK